MTERELKILKKIIENQDELAYFVTFMHIGRGPRLGGIKG